jgi:hypothetical protein
MAETVSVTDLSPLATEDRMGYPAGQLLGGLEMAERGQVGERLASMLQHAAESAESQVTPRNLNAQDETIKAQREAIEVQRTAAEAETKAAEASIRQRRRQQ